MPEHVKTTEIRRYLRRLTPRFPDRATALILESELPADWKRLVKQYGRIPVFDCLRRNLTAGAASRQLQDVRYG